MMEKGSFIRVICKSEIEQRGFELEIVDGFGRYTDLSNLNISPLPVFSQYPQ